MDLFGEISLNPWGILCTFLKLHVHFPVLVLQAHSKAEITGGGGASKLALSKTPPPKTLLLTNRS